MSSKTATTTAVIADKKAKKTTTKPRAKKSEKVNFVVLDDEENETETTELNDEKKIETNLPEKIESIIETETMSAKKANLIFEEESEEEESEDEESEDEEEELAKKLEEIRKKKREKERAKALSEYRKPENCGKDIKDYISRQKAKLRDLCALNGIELYMIDHHDWEIENYLFGGCEGYEKEFEKLSEKLYERKNRAVATTTTTTKKVAKKSEKPKNETDTQKPKIVRRPLSAVFTKATEFKYEWAKGEDYVGIYDPVKKVITWDGKEFCCAKENLNEWVNGKEKVAGNSIADLRGQKTSAKNAWGKAFYKNEKGEWKLIDDELRN